MKLLFISNDDYLAPQKFVSCYLWFVWIRRSINNSIFNLISLENNWNCIFIDYWCNAISIALPFNVAIPPNIIFYFSLWSAHLHPPFAYQLHPFPPNLFEFCSHIYNFSICNNIWTERMLINMITLLFTLTYEMLCQEFVNHHFILFYLFLCF